MSAGIAYLADHPGLIEACAAWAYGEWGSQHDGRLERALKRFRDGARRDAIPLTFVAVSEALPAGMVSLWENDYAPRMDLTPWLTGLYVHSAHRGRGLGAALMMRAESEARRLGFEHLHLYTENAAPYYERLGWQAFDQVPGERRMAVLMRKAVQSA